MTMLGLLLLAVVQASASPAITRQAVPANSIVIPDEIAPAIMPYLYCRLDSVGLPIISPKDGSRIGPSVRVGADCSNVRAEAARRADRMLIDQRRTNGDERRLFIERALASADAFADSARSTPPAQERPNAAH